MADENKDVKEARIRLEAAADQLVRVKELPTKFGARVRWRHNSVVWVRIGQDDWVPITGISDATAPSGHVANFAFELL